MFTGIISDLGTVTAVEHHPEHDSARLTIHAPDSVNDLPSGGSIAVNGACLTAISESAQGSVVVDVIGETLRRTTTGTLAVGSPVNLERCMPAAGRFDGHIVQGHVDGTGTIATIEVHGSWRLIRVAVPAGLGRYIAEKGSIAVDGVSLTVTAVNTPGPASAAVTDSSEAEDDWFEIGVIPTTLADTTLGARAVGDRVNLEVDVVAKYAARLTDYDRAADATSTHDISTQDISTQDVSHQHEEGSR